ncbi:MAG TPA: UDP-3-O-[3-hydroxymyristoyl] N-acetylglucosamine deacetylase [Elusimicrobia bacterium]|nr:MAG: UDP-3-O-[3-hydroxymyristoyl] N-acetylglucosamine deacetylase [Elusimicrobia bacterium GWA2_66_18]OGR72608.1 MAG: UDP-3-O-[3-hydroxymyristoyl] N-acetylglucosamine deacetylase [Elusimicrobia bacterium GWC2_65_9]HAZ07263.1 UDP-3-O-[3-hydroxymyristoyl] N-acetylglucosamine deacetylase [Elusimicrobiota bacterium]
MKENPLQTTIKEEVRLEGVGLHTGNKSSLTFRPSLANTGIRFFRADLPGIPMIPARLAFVVTTVRGTNLGLGEAKVHTIEHVLSACTGLGIDNIDVLTSANEPPIMDGSAMPFVEALLRAGLVDLDAPKRWLHLPHEVTYQAKDGARYRAEPSDRFEISATLIHDHPMMPKMSLSMTVDLESYLAEVARARTFCFEHEVASLQSQGLAQGGSLENAIVIGKSEFHTNAEGLRYQDEFVRHKMLDLIGDLTLIGRPLFKMRITAERLGHAHNVEFAKLLDEAAKKLRKSKNRVLEAK